ncbi:protein snakeskin [Leptopilina boulardi]|uniref:protein snakeskin n=1 Tax=Leptopilina boulardi TaxID=63433 RepID=UPI0021F51AA1|nr:protein snakeskin [Leptopilina boulardi]
MVSVQTIGTIVLKSLKLVINLIILILYRTGYSGEFLGVGGTWNLNEDKNPDAEIVASGVFVGFFIYTAVILLGFCFGSTAEKRSLTEIIMNFVGMIMFLAVGGTALHYWHGYQPEHKLMYDTTERQVGLALGSLCVVEGAAYLIDLILSFLHFAKEEFGDDQKFNY